MQRPGVVLRMGAVLRGFIVCSCRLLRRKRAGILLTEGAHFCVFLGTQNFVQKRCRLIWPGTKPTTLLVVVKKRIDSSQRLSLCPSLMEAQIPAEAEQRRPALVVNILDALRRSLEPRRTAPSHDDVAAPKPNSGRGLVQSNVGYGHQTRSRHAGVMALDEFKPVDRPTMQIRSPRGTFAD